mgnify:CR=1 FL=1
MLGYCWVGVFQFTIDLSGSDGTRFFHVKSDSYKLCTLFSFGMCMYPGSPSKQSKSLVSKNKLSYFMNQ